MPNTNRHGSERKGIAVATFGENDNRTTGEIAQSLWGEFRFPVLVGMLIALSALGVGFSAQHDRRHQVLDLVAAEVVGLRQANHTAFLELVQQKGYRTRYGCSVEVNYHAREKFLGEGITIRLYRNFDEAWDAAANGWSVQKSLATLVINYNGGEPSEYYYK